MKKFLVLMLLLLMALPLRAQTRTWIHNPLVHTDSVQVIVLPDIPAVGQIVSPPDVYAKWWTEISQCTGLPIADSTKARIKYYWVSSAPFVIENTKTVTGDWYQFLAWSDIMEGRLYLTWNAVTDEHIVKHEMIHFLMFNNGKLGGHPPEYFNKCHVETPGT